jgi:hypothetical protein
MVGARRALVVGREGTLSPTPPGVVARTSSAKSGALEVCRCSEATLREPPYCTGSSANRLPETDDSRTRDGDDGWVPLPAWVTGPAFIAASLGALALLGQAADDAHYGIASVDFHWIVYLYWIGAVPAIVLAGRLMMPPDPPER